MLKPVIVGSQRPVSIATATAELKRGAPIGDGSMLVDAHIVYDGANANTNPREKDNDTIAIGELYLEQPTDLNDQWATDQITSPDALVAGDNLGVVAGKFAKVTTGVSFWKFVGEYTNPFEVKMYTIKRTMPTAIGA